MFVLSIIQDEHNNAQRTLQHNGFRFFFLQLNYLRQPHFQTQSPSSEFQCQRCSETACFPVNSPFRRITTSGNIQIFPHKSPQYRPGPCHRLSRFNPRTLTRILRRHALGGWEEPQLLGTTVGWFLSKQSTWHAPESIRGIQCDTKTGRRKRKDSKETLSKANIHQIYQMDDQCLYRVCVCVYLLDSSASRKWW